MEGFIADHFGRKISSLIAIGCAILSFCIFALGSSFEAFAVAEVLNAFTICFWSGAYTALVVDGMGSQSKREGFLESLFSKMNIFSSISVMISGLIGGLIYDLEPRFPFLFASLMMILAYFSLRFFILEKIEVQTQNIQNNRWQIFILCQFCKPYWNVCLSSDYCAYRRLSPQSFASLLFICPEYCRTHPFNHFMEPR